MTQKKRKTRREIVGEMIERRAQETVEEFKLGGATSEKELAKIAEDTRLELWEYFEKNFDLDGKGK